MTGSKGIGGTERERLGEASALGGVQACSPPRREFSSGTTSKLLASGGQKSPLLFISVWHRASVLPVNTVGLPWVRLAGEGELGPSLGPRRAPTPRWHSDHAGLFPLKDSL